jgi:hypothetical protein
MIKVFAKKVRKTGFFQKAGFPGNLESNFGFTIYSRPTHLGDRSEYKNQE